MREIPSIDQLLRRPAVQALIADHGRVPVVSAVRAAADVMRKRLASGEMRSADVASAIEADVPRLLESLFAASLRPVINATGVVLHTNLGRAPLSAAALQRVVALGAYSNLEFDLETGRRGGRDTHAEGLICRLTGAEAAVVVNNNAAATLVTLAALAAGREVVISRGELVEIGGGFRVPDVMAQSGAILREVGTTNRTRAADYAAAIGDRTAGILRVHPSNFRMEGFTERPSLDALVALAQRFGILLIEDIGSGWIGGGQVPSAIRDEPVPLTSLTAGADLVLFSGDKLLGGPQAGIVAGRRDAVAAIRRHPLMRALRVGKMTYAAVEATLQEYAAGRADRTIPVARMIAMTADEIGRRAEALVGQLPDELIAEIIDGVSTVGGGSAPGSALKTRLIALRHRTVSASALGARLRAAHPPVIARIEEDQVLLDVRTVLPEQDEPLVTALRGAATQHATGTPG